MENQTVASQGLLDENEFLRQMEKDGSFEILPCEDAVNLEDSSRFSPLTLEPAQKMYISALMQYMPTTLAAGVLSQAYVVKFPAGMPHTLTALKQGGFGSMLRENGRFVGTASFYPVAVSATMLGVFNAMAVASGQYFLTQINREMRMMTMKLDEILGFLYGDKKAELMAEMAMVRSFYKNYSSMMAHEQQRTAAIASLQGARKTAIKDIEFYVSDLENIVSEKMKDSAELNSHATKAFQIKESLMLSQQLYVVSNMMEVYFAQNFDASYLQSMERNVLTYLDKCDKRILGSFSALKGQINAYKPKTIGKADKASQQKMTDALQAIDALIDSLTNGEENSMRQSVRVSLRKLTECAEFYLSKEGQLYLKQ